MTKKRVQIIDRGFAKIIAELEAAGKSHVSVGVQGDMKRQDGATQADVATWMEYGTRDATGNTIVPARSFMRSTFDESQADLTELKKKILARITAGKLSTAQGLGLIGEWFKARVQKKIASNVPPPLQPETIRKKGSTRTLIDTGQMRQAITYTVKLNTPIKK